MYWGFESYDVFTTMVGVHNVVFRGTLALVEDSTGRSTGPSTAGERRVTQGGLTWFVHDVT